MLFNSVNFILVFLPISLAAFYSVPRALRPLIMAVASSVFYAMAGLLPFVFMILTTIWVYVCALFVQPAHRISGVWLAVSLPLVTLFMFRYLNFALNATGLYQDLSPHLHFFLDVIVPAGISFYTFEMISYSLDVHDGKIQPEKSFIKIYSRYHFFPILMAGPILRYLDLRDQIQAWTERQKIDADWPNAIKFLAYGLAAKVFIADRLAIADDALRNLASLGFIDAAYLIVSYSFRIYFDFWGYSIMAIGLGLMFGVRIPKNFEEPYLSANPRDFWRRWHVSLSNWLRDYVYLKLGGRQRYVRNIVFVFVACGIWHGAGYHFIVWGAAHAFLVLGYRATSPVWDRLPRVLQVALTFSLVSLVWPLFFLDIGAYSALFRNIDWELQASTLGVGAWATLAGASILVFGVRERFWLFDPPARLWPIINGPILHAFVLFAGLLGTTWSRTFIYFRF